LRDVLLWTQVPAGSRPGLFAPEAPAERERAIRESAVDAELREPLATLERLLQSPGSVTGAEVSGACAEIAAWAERGGSLATALAFAQNAALTSPANAAAALEVARIARRMEDHARAELWYRRATGAARRSKRWRIYARSFSGLATLYQDRGNLPAAHRFHLRALRGATRGGLRPERAAALHDLFAVSVEAGRTREAERFAREAFAAYPPAHSRLPELAHDIGYFWMEQGHFQRALPVFQAVLPLVREAEKRLWVEADLARAAAGAGDYELSRSTAKRVRKRCGQEAMAAAAARALIELAHAALQTGDLAAAEEAATEALRLARQRREGRAVLMAEALLEAIAADGATSRGSNRREPRAGGPAADELATELIRTLQELQQVDGSNDGTIAQETEDPVRPSRPRPVQSRR
jgi:tetratricopeptide (TPR) repeat protein